MILILRKINNILFGGVAELLLTLIIWLSLSSLIINIYFQPHPSLKCS